MPKRVYNNVEAHRVIDNSRVVEDVTKITLPTVTHPTTSISVSGMAMDVDMPNTTHLDAMDLQIAHNNGVNGRYLASPGKHVIEARVVRQRYNTAKGELEHESVKFRATCLHVETSKGDIQTGNPYGSTEKYSVLRYEEEVDGKVTVLVDAVSGLLKWNGKDYSNVLESMLS